jgi:hypothetical protein
MPEYGPTRAYVHIDAGMSEFIMAVMGCSFEDVPAALDEWMRTKAIGSGVVVGSPVPRVTTPRRPGGRRRQHPRWTG